MSDDRQPILSVEGLNVDFYGARGRTRVVNDVSFELAAGETLAILGESGSGKSMTASAIMGLIPTPPGRVTGRSIAYRGQNLLTLDSEARREISGRRIAMIFQDTLAALNPVHSVGRQVAETLQAHGTPAAQAMTAALALLQRVGVPAERAGAWPHQFSGGQRQRIMIAMALALKPDILIADEPTTALDVTVQAQILQLLASLQDETGMAILLITHDLGVVAEMADHVVVMYRGSIVETGDVRHVLKSPQHAYTRQLLSAMPVHDPGRGSPKAPVDAEVLFQARSLEKSYAQPGKLFALGAKASIKALNGISFCLRAGEVVGVVGESGSGKSTLGRVMLGLSPPSAGKMLFRGQNLFALLPPELAAYRRDVQAVLQDPTASLNPRMTIEQIISEPWVLHPDVLERAGRRARVQELLSQVGLNPDLLQRYPHQFSGGQRQRIAIARSLALKPRVLICDEAVSALDMSIQAQVMDLLRDLRRDLGLTYIFITHDLMLLRDFATRILVMNKGKIVEDGPTSQVLDHPQNAYTRELLAANLTLNPDRRHLRGGLRAAQ